MHCIKEVVPSFRVAKSSLTIKAKIIAVSLKAVVNLCYFVMFGSENAYNQIKL